MSFSSSSLRDRETGLLGWVSLEVGGLFVVDGVAVRQTRDGRLYLAYPTKRAASGWDHYYLRPIDDETRREVERQVLEQLGELIP